MFFLAFKFHKHNTCVCASECACVCLRVCVCVCCLPAGFAISSPFLSIPVRLRTHLFLQCSLAFCNLLVFFSALYKFCSLFSSLSCSVQFSLLFLFHFPLFKPSPCPAIVMFLSCFPIKSRIFIAFSWKSSTYFYPNSQLSDWPRPQPVPHQPPLPPFPLLVPFQRYPYIENVRITRACCQRI